MPSRIHFFNKTNFPFTLPAFKLLFAQDCFIGSYMHFIINESVNAVVFSESINGLMLMLMQSLGQITGHADNSTP